MDSHVKVCRGCKKALPLSDFYVVPRGLDERRTVCKVCLNEVRTAKRYNLTVEQYRQMIEQQDGLCAVCGGPPSNRKALAVDHNHETGEVRELLCDRCNTALGLVGESVEILSRLITYLAKHNSS